MSGGLAFTSDQLLLVTEAGTGTVHILDFVDKECLSAGSAGSAGLSGVGFLDAPSSWLGPRGVASKDEWVAVSTWPDTYGVADHAVWLYRGHGVHWEPVRAIRYSSDDLLLCPRGLKFFTSYPQDGTGTLSFIVAHAGKGGASIFSAIDGRFISHVLPTDLNRHHKNFCVYDVEEGDGGWLLACGNSVRGRPQAVDAQPGFF